MQKMTGLVRRCVDDYDMIKEGDKIAVGVSGGKDSLVLLVLNFCCCVFKRRFTWVRCVIPRSFCLVMFS